MQLERLRLAGFKSFADPTELAIAPGLTGIVGPNGCGKSNLVDALLWVMGEASVRRLRGGEMDDVIFAGSASRPARNLAEVVLTLDGAVAEVARRIARGDGSSYRIDGREARARDVQLLFADAATGAHSGALVSQGRVAALIAAKPADRRLLLDEAAGTAGLHARRHEAELKLRAADDNLARLDDVTATLNGQIEALRKQARQAQRYRRLGEQIRRAEAQLLAARWQAAAAEAEQLGGALEAAERAAIAAAAAAGEQENLRLESDAALPALRQDQAEAAATVQRLAHARDMLERELAQVVAARAEAGRRRDQLQADLRRETEQLADAEAALGRLAEERRLLEAQAAAAAATEPQAAAGLVAAVAALEIAEAGLQQMTEARAAAAARRGAFERQCRDLAERRARLEARLADQIRQRDSLLAALVAPAAATEAAAAVSNGAAEVEAGRAASAAAGEALIAVQKHDAAAVDRAREADRVVSRLAAEAEALASLQEAPDGADSQAAPILTQLKVPEGFEAAVAALFDGELSAPLLPADRRESPGIAAGWVELAPLAEPAALPAGAQPLAGDIAAPAALARRLSQSGRVENPAAGWQLQPLLQPGQSLVDKQGSLWRWDGFVRLTPGSTSTAERLRQRNRLVALEGEIAAAAAVARDAAEQAARAHAAREAAAAAERQAAARLRAAEERLARARAAEADLARRSLAAETRLAALNDAIGRADGELAEVAAQLAESERGLALLPSPDLARTALDAARTETAAARRREAEARAALDGRVREDQARRRRLAVLAEEQDSWRRRQDGAATQCAVLHERQGALAADIAALAARPAALAGEAATLARDGAAAAEQQRVAAAALTAGEMRLRAAADRARQAEAAVAEAREGRARLAARRDAAGDMLARLRDEIGERFGGAPADLAALAGSDAELSDSSGIAARLDRLLREREAIGPVNLIAEREAAEVEARLAGLQHERADLVAAIARLRQGIATLDQEGRQRLRIAFERLNRHFAELFGRLFGGGRAELAWTGDSDPLAAGLDIMASPPGKRLQSLSLLSGGEQALTALALIFAMFLTRPAPICVLDEVDAPLDDANVDRFCRLVADTADATGTRFLLITHHRITMARMDRLFGVTMAEGGVSQLVSVDLARAAELRQTA
jgi:chromosome segregation protein